MTAGGPARGLHGWVGLCAGMTCSVLLAACRKMTVPESDRAEMSTELSLPTRNGSLFRRVCASQKGQLLPTCHAAQPGSTASRCLSAWLLQNV